MKPVRPILYCRVSSQMQVEGTSLDDQERRLRSECVARGWGDPLVLREEGVSAKNTNRPVLQEALALLKSGERNAIVVTKLDRLCRSAKDTLELADRSRDERWEVVVLDGSVAFDSTTANGRLIFTMLAALAQFEREQLAERIAASFEHQRVTGTGKVIPAAITKQILAEVQSGKSCRAVAASLNERSVPTARGGQWRPSTVSQLARRVR